MLNNGRKCTFVAEHPWALPCDTQEPGPGALPLIIRRSLPPAPTRDPPRAQESLAPRGPTSTADAELTQAKPLATVNALAADAEGRRAEASTALGADARTTIVPPPKSAAVPMGLQFLALQAESASARQRAPGASEALERLEVDASKAAAVLERARGRSKGGVEPDVPMLHRAAGVGTTGNGGQRIEPLSFEAVREGAGEARGGVKLDGAGALDVDIGATRRVERDYELADGAKGAVTHVSAARGEVLKGTFSGERSRSARVEREHDGVRVTEEQSAGARGNSRLKQVEVFTTRTERVQPEGEPARATRVGASAGLRGTDRLVAQGERVALALEEAPDGASREVEHGYAGRAEVHRMGFVADLQRRSSDGAGGRTAGGGNLVYDPTGLSVGRTHSHARADGDAAGGGEGVKVSDKSAGVTATRTSRQRLSDREALDTGRTFDLMLGNRHASAAMTRSSTRAQLDRTHTIRQQSDFEHFGTQIEAFRTVTDHGPVNSDDPALAGKHLVELHQKVDGGGSASLGHMVDAIGIYGGLSLQRGKEVRYRTHLEADAAAAAAQHDEARGAMAAVRRQMPGASVLGASTVVVPDLSAPEAMRLHDEVGLSVTGSVSVKGGASAYGARVGIEGRVTGDFALTVKKVATDVMEVELAPTRIRSLRGTAGVVLAEGHASLARASSFRQRFAFELSTKSGKLAYAAALAGHMPGALLAADVNAREEGLGLVRQDDMPLGVTRLLVEKIEVRQADVEGNLGWMFLKAGRNQSRRVTHHMVADANVSVNLHARGLERRRRTLLSGNETTSVTGSVRATTSYDERGRKVSGFDTLVLEARLSDEKVKGLEIDERMVSELNAAFGLSLPKTGQRGKKERVDVAVQVSLTRDGLSRIASASEAETARVARERHGEMGALRELVTTVSTTTDPRDAARVVQRYISDRGVYGMGQVVALAGAEAELALSSSSSAYERPLQDAKTWGGRYAGRPWDKDASESALTARYRAVRDTAVALEDARLRLLDDPFYRARPDERTALAAQLQESLASLRPLFDLSSIPPEDAIVIYQKLDRGWTTALQRAFMEDLLEQCGLESVSTTLRRAVGTSHRQRGDAMVRTRTTVERGLLTLFGDERTRVTSATLREDGRGVKGLTLRTDLYDEKSRGGDLAARRRRLSRAFGVDLGGEHGSDPRRGVGRTVTVSCHFDAAALARLRTAACDGEAVRRAASAGGDLPRVKGLAAALARAPQEDAVARAIERHVERHGVEGVGDVHRLGRGALSMRSSTGAYDAAVAAVATVLERYPSPLSPDATNRHFARRFADVELARQRVQEAEGLLADDDLVPRAERAAVGARLREAERVLTSAVRVDHLDPDEARALVGRLRSGWVTRAEAAAAAAIEAATREV
jgi:hypothetical protein